MTTISYPKRLASVAVALALAAALAGCGGDAGADDGIATLGGTPTVSAGAGAQATPLDDEERRLKFAECMRANGVPMDDPGDDGPGVRIRVGQGVKAEDVEAAMDKCKEYAPNGGQPVRLDADQLAKLREFARCMRANGVPDFPDPDASGRITMRRFRGMDTDREAFEQAQESCRQFRPEPRRSGGPR